ncbi:MAG: RES family NAD+ phosphorylase [Gemmatimonadetes bacterium]|nr:RES family NAD+ phosphorylase [Gemmatimonadota bacterium]MXX35904.1 RES family NAD+ phosphorylase [Gemmatimonadota bacterium]MYA11724.1 RES family NAD+ phosphorylase [Gemmatimonadota bacterium]MYD13549.1 RES family NAD+ phosphorylase [Gemmatimonadota bacterium]MYE70074.1 RES family NAD+ phosphorylase [Gemmatimonadota bacterium]
MIEAWRLASPEHSGTVGDMLSGEGARRYGGRWNRPGRRAVYLGGSLALASMELLVHLKAPAVLETYRKLRVRIPRALVAAVSECDLPADWAAPRMHPGTQEMGDRWLRSRASAVLRVPSAVVIGEVNYIANPRHPDFGRIDAGTIRGFRFDARVLKMP